MIAVSRTIRVAREGDAAALSALAERTFRDAFGASNRAADMDLHCARSYSPERQAAEIVDPLGTTVVAEHDGALVAYVQLHRGRSPGCVPHAPAVEIRRFYVLQAWHGARLARELMEDSVARAGAEGAAALWLGVWEHNPRAIRFYEKQGFTTVGEQAFVLGSDPQRDLVMVRPLAGPAR